MALTPGNSVGPYEILAVLGAGGMGEVYRARDPRLGREVAIKVLAVQRLGDAGALRRLEQEARTLAALNHPNLLSVYDVGTAADGQPYIVSELLDGQSLRQRLAGGALPAARAVELAIQIARGLAAAHDKGIVHRDLKPDNIFLTSDGRAKILDFGLAKLSGAAAAEAATLLEQGTAPGAVLGTVGYMAPEQVRGQAADHRADIFAFGAVLYEMLAGARAFRGDSAVEVMSAILKEEPAPLALSSSAPGLPAPREGSRPSMVSPALDRIVRHCLEKEPRQRFQSADDIAFHLGELTQASSASVTPLAAPRRRRPGVIAGYAAAGAIVVAAVAWLAWGGMPKAAGTPEFVQVTFEPGLTTGARFLPGQQSFLVSTRQGQAPARLFAGQLASGGLQALPVTGDQVAAVSSRGEALLLSGNQSYDFAGVGALSRLPLNGDAPHPVMDDVSAATWSPDGVTMAVVRREPANNQETLEYPPGHVLFTQTGWINSVRVAPDGRHIAFIVHPVFGDDRGRVAIVDLAGHARMLTPLYASANGLAWGPGGHEVWYTAAPSGILRALYAVTPGGRIRRLLAGATTLELDDVAPDGRALVTSSEFRMAARVFTPAQPGGRDVSIENGTQVDAMSDDGRTLLLTEFNTAVYSSYVRGVDGAPPVSLGDGYGEALSPDGRWALLQAPDSGQLVLAPTGAGEPRPLPVSKLTWRSFSDASLSGAADAFLPDSQSFIAQGSLPGSPARDYRVHFNGAATPVTPPGVTGALPTPDGRSVLGRRADGRWFLYPLAGGAPVAVAALKPGDSPLRFGATDDELLLGQLAVDNLSFQLFLLHLRGGQRQLLADIHPNDPGFESLNGFAVSRDGKSYAYTETTDPGSLFLVSGLH